MIAIGFSIHTGWAAAVAVAGPKFTLLARKEILLADEEHDARFVYHVGADHPEHAAAIVRKAAEIARKRAAEALRGVIAELGGKRLVAALPPPRKPPPELATVLKSHTLIHSAEGALFTQAVAAGAEDAGCRVVLTAPASLPDFGKPGPPWGKDQKQAAALAWAALR